MIHLTRCLAVALVAGCLLSAQELVVTVSPNPAIVGAPITVTAKATTSNLYTPLGCLITSIRSGTPGGPVVGYSACTFLPTLIPLYGGTAMRTGVWNQNIIGGMATPGLYWFEIGHTVGQFGAPTTTEWFSVTISDPFNVAPALAAVNAPLFGSTFQMSLTAGAAHAQEPYLVALSFTTNSGFPIPGGYVSLDIDPLFNLGLTLEPALFTNFVGSLDVLGNSFPPIGINIPPVMGALVVPIHAQAIVLPTSGGFVLSNDLTIAIH